MEPIALLEGLKVIEESNLIPIEINIDSKEDSLMLK